MKRSKTILQTFAPIRKRGVKSEDHILSGPVETEYDGSELIRSGSDYLGSSAKET